VYVLLCHVSSMNMHPWYSVGCSLWGYITRASYIHWTNPRYPPSHSSKGNSRSRLLMYQIHIRYMPVCVCVHVVRSVCDNASRSADVWVEMMSPYPIGKLSWFPKFLPTVHPFQYPGHVGPMGPCLWYSHFGVSNLCSEARGSAKEMKLNG
jgi:hypothetical protein